MRRTGFSCHRRLKAAWFGKNFMSEYGRWSCTHQAMACHGMPVSWRAMNQGIAMQAVAPMNPSEPRRSHTWREWFQDVAPQL